MSDLPAAQKIDQICEAFEDDLLDNKQPQLEQFVERIDSQYQTQLLAKLLRIDLSYSHSTSDSHEQYRRRFPEHSQVIDEVLERHRTDELDTRQTKKIDRYTVVKRIGSGGFGLVFEGYDPQLKRSVAIKVPREKWARDDARVKKTLAEAQILAGLTHPNILPVYHAGKCSQFGFFIVTALIEGQSLSQLCRSCSIPAPLAVDVVCQIADALQYAHKKNVIHRDVKPANIMLDGAKHPYLVDFGLAMDTTALSPRRSYVGTPRYMSPEQARGDIERLDQTTDIYSLGIVLSEVLTTVSSDLETQSIGSSQRDATGQSFEVNKAIPPELQRICLRATAAQSAERYPDAGAFARELRQSQATLENAQPGRIENFVPRGLSPFEASDANFFRDLLPGPRDAQGMPASLARLQQKVANSLSSSPSPVAVVIGPAGAGKSSFVKAGLIPLLPRSTAVVCIDANLPNLERQLLTSLNRMAESSGGESIWAAVTEIQKGEWLPDGQKLLIVVDQFESWLGRNQSFHDSDLVSAMQQCDGRVCQFLLLIRDDCFTATSRLMRHLEIPLIQDVNSFTSPTFDKHQIKRVLEAYGHSFGQYHGSYQQQQFVDSVADELLADDANVVPVRLVVLAETLKELPWVPATLERLGGVNGVLGSFLRTTLANIRSGTVASNNPDAIRTILRELTPAENSETQLPIRSIHDLRTACEWPQSNDDFDQLITQMVNDLRLVSKVGDDSTLDADTYRLAHSFLIRPVSAWLQQRRMETMRGRAEVRFDEWVKVWSESRQVEHLPSSFEFLSFQLFTDNKRWSSSGVTMMQHAKKRLVPRWIRAAIAAACLLLMAAFIGFWLDKEANKLKQEKAIADLQSALTSSPYWAKENMDRFFQATSLPQRKTLIDQLPPCDLALSRLRLVQLNARDGRVDVGLLVKFAVELAEEQYGLKKSQIHVSEFQNIMRTINTCAGRSAVIDSVQEEFEKTTDQNGLEFSITALNRRRARLAIVGINIGELKWARQVCSRKAKPGANAEFLWQSRFFRGDANRLLQAIVVEERSDVKALLITCLGDIRRTRIADEVRESIVEVLYKLLNDGSRVAVACAASQTLQRWGCALPSDDYSHICMAPECERNSVDMVMVKSWSLFPDTEWVLRNTESFIWASQTETTNSQFLQFILADDLRAESWKKDRAKCFNSVTSQPGQPFALANLMDAMLFCNWLSDLEGYQPVYVISDANDIASVMVDNGNDGYRLPTYREWKLLAKVAPTHTKSLSFLAVTSENSHNKLPDVRSRFANPNGLFDMYGSVWEWTIAPRYTWKASAIMQAQLWGGSFNFSRYGFRRPKIFDRQSDVDLSEVNEQTLQPLENSTKRSPGYGFRVIRNGPESEHKYVD